MTEKEIQLLGFEKQEDGGIEDEFYYYTYDIVDGFELISSSNNEVGEAGEWFVEVFNTEPAIRFTEFGEVHALINLLQSRIDRRQTMKQTAVEWLVEQLPMRIKNSMMGEIEQAKEMEKEQLSDAWYAGDEDGAIHEFEQYYNETYESNVSIKTELNDALLEFQKKYPSVTSGDLQTFILGWQAAQSNAI